MKTNVLYSSLLFFLGALLFHHPNDLMAQQTGELNRLVSVSGEGTVKVTPDMASVRFGVVVRNENPEEARRINAETSREAMNTIRGLGIEDSKLSLQTLRLQPVREYNQETRRQEEKGYEAARELVVIVENLDQLPTLVAEIVQKGANRLNGITYGLKNKDAAKDEALVLAVQRARVKAELMGSTLGVQLGRVVQIQEEGMSIPQPIVMREAAPQVMMSKAAAPEPDAYAAGEMEVKASVRVTFELE